VRIRARDVRGGGVEVRSDILLLLLRAIGVILLYGLGNPGIEVLALRLSPSFVDMQGPPQEVTSDAPPQANQGGAMTPICG
jgi:hypothetical protein